MSISDDEFEKLIGLVDANRAGLERLRMELEQLKWILQIQGLRTSPQRTLWPGRGPEPSSATLSSRSPDDQRTPRFNLG